MINRTIYLIESQCGRVKIGCSADPVQRADFMGRGTPYPVRLIAAWPGRIADEQALHRRFAPFRRYREWFVVHGEFASFVAQMRGSGVARIPEWSEIDGSDAEERERDRRRRQSATLRLTLNAKQEASA